MIALALLLQLAVSPPSEIQDPPKLLRSDPHVYPPEAQAAGHFGKVSLAGVITPEGRIAEPRIEESSRSELLDRAALAEFASYEFAPARNRKGEKLATRVRTQIEYDKTLSATGGLLGYRCADFTTDMDWYEATFPDRSFGDLDLYDVLVRFRAKGIADPLARGRAAQAQAEDWAQARTACRERPAELFIDQLSIGPALKRSR
jgi:TonB family protein